MIKGSLWVWNWIYKVFNDRLKYCCAGTIFILTILHGICIDKHSTDTVKVEKWKMYSKIIFHNRLRVVAMLFSLLLEMLIYVSTNQWIMKFIDELYILHFWYRYFLSYHHRLFWHRDSRVLFVFGLFSKNALFCIQYYIHQIL